MTKLTKTFLALALIGFAAGGSIDFGGFLLNTVSPMVLPLGAVFAGAALIFFMMEKEMAQFDAAESKKFALIRHDDASDLKCTNCNGCQCSADSAMTSPRLAHEH